MPHESSPAASTACPTCGTELPVDPRYVTWCHGCGWNLVAPPSPDRTGRLDRIASAAGRRLGDRMTARLAAVDDVAPRLTAATIAAYAIAVAVHAFVAGIVVLGAWLLLGDSGLFPKIAGCLLLGLALLMRPRLGKRPKEGIVARADAPALYALADEIADSFEAPRPDAIAITTDYNASWSVVGIRRERILTLGMPLLAVLEPQERVALIAHELAHGRHGDATRGVVVGSAIDSLSELYATLTPPGDQLGADLGPAELVSRPVVWLLAQPIRLLLLLELHLLLENAKRAEYLADASAARVAGTAAVVGTHEKLLLGATTEVTVHQFALNRSRAEGDVFDALRAASARLPERELERRRRLARLEESRLGATHPPTGRRIDLLLQRPALEGVIRIDEERQAAVEADLRPVRRSLSHRIVEEYRESVAG